MPLSIYGLLEASLLVLNAIAILNRQRFLKKVRRDEVTVLARLTSKDPDVVKRMLALTYDFVY